MDNLIKPHKAVLSWRDRQSGARVLHTAAFCLLHGVRAAIPKTSPLAKCEFARFRERLIKIGARAIEQVATHPRPAGHQLAHAALFRCDALGLMPSGP
jgi:hypothetical protein